ncbi:hypothetical protein F2Q69_00043662 [Brassica cretica]|uniref:Uncharacterized protein n=1 Tax=Brassica cretica TaxID=69181 RepID=A0A8S9N382_BRACR|nr:hypothetical protein F2Q69_00043662 [Brassica cretica]
MSASGSSTLGDVDSFLKSLRCLVCGIPCHQLSLLGFLSGSFFSEERAVAVDRRLVLIGPSVLLLVRRLLRRMRRHYSPTFPNNGIGGCKLLFILPEPYHQSLKAPFSRYLAATGSSFCLCLFFRSFTVSLMSGSLSWSPLLSICNFSLLKLCV